MVVYDMQCALTSKGKAFSCLLSRGCEGPISGPLLVKSLWQAYKINFKLLRFNKIGPRRTVMHIQKKVVIKFSLKCICMLMVNYCETLA